MYKITQNIVESLNFNDVLWKLLVQNPTNKGFNDQVVYKTLLTIGLTSGLPLKFIVNLKWNDIVFINSKSQVQIKERFKITEYRHFPINNKLDRPLSEFYNYINQPPLESKIIDSLSKEKSLDSMLLSLNILLGINKIKGIDKSDALKYTNRDLIRILFGRQVLKVCGYTNETSTFLKIHFKLKTNRELFDFLGYESRNAITYKLSDISLVEGLNKSFEHGEAQSFLDDNKHFYVPIDNSKNHYSFQHLQVFYDFLNQVSLYKYSISVQNITILLLISLTNGIRLSSLLKLKWSDVIDIDGKSLVFSTRIGFKKTELVINKHLLLKIQQYFQNVMALNGVNDIEFGFSTDEPTFTNEPNLDSHVFITNTGNPLTQPSLHREIIKALKLLGFIHAEKFTTKSTLIMYGRRIVELKGNHSPTIKALKKHFNYRTTKELFDFLYIDEYKGNDGNYLGSFSSEYEHILYNI